MAAEKDMGNVIWDLTKIIAVAGATALMVRFVLQRG
jgi:hypothetical protein